MQLQESGEMYLETLLILSKKESHVRSLDIAEYMGYSKPSVSRAVHILKDANMIEIDKYGFLTLTDEGLSIAEKIYERHLVLKDIFIKLGVDEQIANDDACRIEHAISDQTFDAIKRYVYKEQ